MSIFTRTELDAQIAAWKKALLACSSNQSYTIEGRTYTRADLPQIRATLQFLASELRSLDGQSGPVFLPAAPRRLP